MAVAGVVPSVKLVKYYRLTKIIDYLLMAMAFIIAICEIVVIELLNTGHTDLIIYQLNDFLYPTFILMFLIHGFRLKWKRPPNVLLIISAIWYALLIVCIFFYKLDTLPNHGKVMFMNMKNTSTRDVGAVFKINGVIIMGRGFEFLAHGFRVYSIIILLFAYWGTTNYANMIKVRTARRIFIISLISSLVFPIVLMGEMLQVWNIAESFEWHLFDLITFVGVAYISIRYPQTLLLSKTQIIRALEVLETIDAYPPDTIEDNEIEDYLVLVSKTITDLLERKSAITS